MAESSIEPGGFLPPSLPSPVPSNTSTIRSSQLPHPRSKPLVAGSYKEETARRYVESRLMHISRRYTKKHQPPEPDEDVHGYQSMSEVCKDLGEVVDVLWVSGTPSLQIPYLLNIALSVTTYLSAFPPSPSPTFSLLRKLDHAFSSLLKGQDIISGESLPGFDNGRRGGMSRTDMVRCKSLVEATRVQIVEVMSKEAETDLEPDSPEDDGNETGMETDGGMSVSMQSTWDIEDESHNMDVARVYADTIVQLGELLGNDTTYDPVASA
ncbi:hypothetical protein BP6252_03080 [Coleophoma cylindrospora]|uniref:Meiotic recombination protein DMC1 n=1 Tax=Coleophoma cylindrospora TaxID=1849047 RepID=A0A3D8S6Q9_9HELO|nr:hypothetical protein BP6252_03080 [Coleophoma cylindrospora]